MEPRDLLTVVERSPQAAAAHDRAGWVGLFSTDARIEDPVGARPHVGATQIGRFYDTFIGPRDITFHRDLDIVRGSVVVRDLELEVAMGSAVKMRIPAFLRYDLREDEEDEARWKFTVLRAYWELPAMMWQFARNGRHAVPVAVQLAQGLLRNQGAGGTVGFAAGFRRPGPRRKKLVGTFVDALARQDTSAAMRMLSSGATITYGDDDAIGVAELSEDLHGARAVKMVGAGDTVAVSTGAGHRRGVLFARFARRGNVITEVRYFQGE